MLLSIINYLNQKHMITSRGKISPNEYLKLNHSGAIIMCRDKILLVQGRKTGKWSLPKGHANFGENPMACAIREIEEETGICLRGYQFRREVVRLRVGYYFFVELNEQFPINPKDSSEILSSGWFNIDDIKNNPDMFLNVDANRIFGIMKELPLDH